MEDWVSGPFGLRVSLGCSSHLVTGLRGSAGLRRKSLGAAGNHPKIVEKLILEDRVSRVADHWVTGCTVFAHIRVTGSLETTTETAGFQLWPPDIEDRTSGRIGLGSRVHWVSLISPDLTIDLTLCSQLSHLPFNLSISLSHLPLSVFR